MSAPYRWQQQSPLDCLVTVSAHGIDIVWSPTQITVGIHFTQLKLLARTFSDPHGG
jgi:hypothetical protein